MPDPLTEARTAVNEAIDATDDSTVREQLQRVDEGLDELSGDEAPDDPQQQGERLETVEEKLVGLGDQVSGPAQTHVENARDHIDEFRRRYAQDWQ